MSKMRENMPAILVGLAILFVAMIVFEWGMDITGRNNMQYTGNVLGKVNGEEITYPDFEKVLNNAVQQYRASTKKEPDEQTMTELRDEVWNEMVNQILLKQAARRLGIVVTDQEIVNWVTNAPETLPDPIKKEFEDSTGHINYQILHAALSSTRPEVEQFWNSVQDYLMQQRMQEKLASRLYSAVRVPESTLRMQFEQQNVKLDAAYVLFPASVLFPDSTIQVTESQMRDYYSSHQNDYRTQPTRRLKFVVLPIVASREDSSEVKSEIERVAALAHAGTNFLDLVKEYSDTPYNDKFVSHGELGPTVEEKAFAAKKGEIVGPFLASDGFHLIKVMDEENGKNEFVHAAHILIHVIPGPDSVSSYKLADKIAAEARGGANFADLAKKYSQDPGTASRGGDLGWFGKGMMVAPFQKAAFGGRVGQVVGPVRTQFGLHIIKILGKDSRELKIADIKMGIKPSEQTKEDIKQHAEDFIYIAKQDGFNKAANTIGVAVHQTPPFQKGSYIPSVGNNPATATWAFKGSLGDISNVTTISQGEAVFMISDIKDAGVTPFSELSPQIRSILVRKKQFDDAVSYASQLEKKLTRSDSLDKLVQLDPRLHYSTTGQFSPATYVPGVGLDYAFMAEVAMLKPGEISKPVEGKAGVYLIQLLSKTPFDSTSFKIQQMTLMQEQMQQMKQRIVSDWLQNLKKSASIVDNRARFFR